MAIEKLKGEALITIRRRLLDAGYKVADICRVAGYVTIKQDGTKRINFTEFYEELLYTQGSIKRVKVEYTDTFNGECNYSWVKRAQFTVSSGATSRQIVTAAKWAVGMTGVRCDKIVLVDTIVLTPRNECTQITINTF